MSQAEVLEILEKKKDWMTTKEIAEKLGKGLTSIRNNTGRLYRQGEIIRKMEANIVFWKLNEEE